MKDLPKPIPKAIFYEDEHVYACLANHPLTKGHVVVVWKEHIEDIHLLEQSEFKKLMLVVEKVRDAMLEVLNLEKVYLMYFDEIKHVHWHLVPRYDEKGINALMHEPASITEEDLLLANRLRQLF